MSSNFHNNNQTQVLSNRKIYLNVYDMTDYNQYMYNVGIGVFHSGLEIDETEYSFGGHPTSETGIFSTVPRLIPVEMQGKIKLREVLEVGETNKTSNEIKNILRNMTDEYRGMDYDLFEKNCNHFTNDFCVRLCGNSIPNYLNRLAYLGSFFKCIIPEYLIKPPTQNDYDQQNNNSSNNNNNQRQQKEEKFQAFEGNGMQLGSGNVGDKKAGTSYVNPYREKSGK